MDVSVMHSFKNKIQDHDFSRSASERRLLLSHIIGKAWDMVDKKAIISGFIKANHIPKGHRDANGKFRTYLLSPPEDAVVPE
ncbi:hypothetical protein PPTG_23212 [Phytophthora nicotianae INRA-310]|uniref:DDE-1 domain-containing protein n=1 Tax=Phytophthora nicotianae (strain INRA-310) TaxID=761204 RepID=W2Q373_PHYN3|nr:hypothetical protein PPTG_23212 [Phytophthora nicotianae INRA-310]ETN06984.1 hypothetical protein PPTG_23212 [Phytophthora nicotianae INRA-310]